MFCLGKVANGDNADIATNSYYRYKEDARLLKSIGLNSYRFSISWSRIIPRGKGSVNPNGIEHYNKVIDDLIRHNITPFVTLFHWVCAARLLFVQHK